MTLLFHDNQENLFTLKSSLSIDYEIQHFSRNNGPIFIMDAESPLFACSYSTNIILDKLDNTGEFLAVSNETGHLSILDSESKKGIIYILIPPFYSNFILVISIGEFPDSLFDLDWNKNNDNIVIHIFTLNHIFNFNFINLISSFLSFRLLLEVTIQSM